MGVTSSDGRYFPHVFFVCPRCGHKAVYKMITPLATGLRCKSCKLEKWIPKGQWTNDEMELSLMLTPLVKKD